MRNTFSLNLTIIFEHLGLMKKTQISNSYGNTFAFSYLHLTLQEYLAALHIFYSPGLKVPTRFGKRDVLRFLAGLCCDNDNVSKIVDTLLQSVIIRDQCSLPLARCVYECKAIVQKIPIVRKRDRGMAKSSGTSLFLTTCR